MTGAPVDYRHHYTAKQMGKEFTRDAQYCTSRGVPRQPGGSGTLDPHLGGDHVALIEDHLRDSRSPMHKSKDKYTARTEYTA